MSPFIALYGYNPEIYKGVVDEPIEREVLAIKNAYNAYKRLGGSSEISSNKLRRHSKDSITKNTSRYR